MKYYIDTEFREDFTKPWFGKSRHFIELISIAIVADDGREYYAVSKDFDVDAVWNKFEYKDKRIGNPYPGERPWQRIKEYWLRDNVLKALWVELYRKEGTYGKTYHPDLIDWNLRGLKNLIRWHGKTNKQIAQEIVKFIQEGYSVTEVSKWGKNLGSPEFYGYYADYDWVLFCSLFGRMIDLPSGFPMYMRDLKQLLDYKIENVTPRRFHRPDVDDSFEVILEQLKSCDAYPREKNSHYALDDARWNKKLHEFITNPKNYQLL